MCTTIRAAVAANEILEYRLLQQYTIKTRETQPGHEITRIHFKYYNNGCKLKTSYPNNVGCVCPSSPPPPPPTVPGLQQGCLETEVPMEVPAGELSQLQVHVLQPAVSQAEAQELRQVRVHGSARRLTAAPC